MNVTPIWRALVWFLCGGVMITATCAQSLPGAHLADIQSAVGPSVVSVAQQWDGVLWLGTEGSGVFRYDERAQPGHQLTKYSTQDGSLVEDSVYALCVDKENRVWAGHGSHGVSVFDGKKWQNYDILDGPIGERVYAMTCCPKDGCVWIATSAGITRYNPGADTWQNYTREDGLPEDQATCLKCDPETGDLLVGFKTKGIEISRFSDNYASWSGPPYFVGQSKADHGTGLPSGMINDVLITKTGIFCAATTQGLGWSVDHGQSWKFIRGANWADKVQLLRAPLPGFTFVPGSEEALPPDDAITSLAELPDGGLALGLWKQGLCSFDLISEATSPITLPKINYRTPDSITKLLTLLDGRLMLAAYGAGFYVDPPPANAPLLDKIRESRAPQAAQPFHEKDLIALRARLNGYIDTSPGPSDTSPVTLLSEDWRTGGDFLGRYGRFWTCLCGVTTAPPGSSFLWGAGDQPVLFTVGRSRQHRADDSWVAWLDPNISPRSLEMPFPIQDPNASPDQASPTSGRLQGEWNDNAENGYARDYDGPNLRCNLGIPSGLYILSYYTINENGQTGQDRFRDYRVTLREHTGDLADIEGDFTNEPELSSTRTMSFVPGCYTRWIVRGPANLALEINRNFSCNAKMSALMLDTVDELPPPYLETWQNYHDPTKHAQFESNHFGHSESAPEVVARALLCLDQLDTLEYKNPALFARVNRKAYLEVARYLRVGLAAQEPNLIKGYRECLFHLGLFEEWEKMVTAEFGKSPRAIEKSIHLSSLPEGNGKGRTYVERVIEGK